MIVEHRQSFLDRSSERHVWRRRPADHDHFYAKRARGRDLAVSRAATAVLGEDRVDALRQKKFALSLLGKRAARQKVIGIGQVKRRLDRIDAADQVEMLSGQGKRCKFLPAERDEDVARLVAQRGNAFLDAFDHRPSVALNRLPFGTAKRKRVDARLFGSSGGIGGNAPREGMCGIDQDFYPVFEEIFCEPFGAAEASDAYRDRLPGRIARPAGQRKRHVEIGSDSKPCRQKPRFRRAAEDQDAVGHHVF